MFIQRSGYSIQQKAVVNFVYFCILSGRTEYQATHGTRLRRTSTFERRPSKRYPSRRHSTFKGKCLYMCSLNQSCRCPVNSYKWCITSIKSVWQYKKKNMSDHLKIRLYMVFFLPSQSPLFVSTVFNLCLRLILPSPIYEEGTYGFFCCSVEEGRKLHQTQWGKACNIVFEEVHLSCRVEQCPKASLTCLSSQTVLGLLSSLIMWLLLLSWQ